MKRFALLLSILLCLPLMAQKQTKHYNNSSQAFNELMAPWKEMYDAYRAKDGGALSYGNYEIRTGHGLDGEPAPCLWDAAAGKWIVAPATGKEIAWYKKQMKKKYQIPEGTREWDRMFFMDSQKGPMAGCPERFNGCLWMEGHEWVWPEGEKRSYWRTRVGVYRIVDGGIQEVCCFPVKRLSTNFSLYRADGKWWQDEKKYHYFDIYLNYLDILNSDYVVDKISHLYMKRPDESSAGDFTQWWEYVVYDWSGKEVTRYDMTVRRGQRIWLRSGDKWTLVDQQMNPVALPYDKVGPVEDAFYNPAATIVCKDGMWGVLDTNDQILIPLVYPQLAGDVYTGVRGAYQLLPRVCYSHWYIDTAVDFAEKGEFEKQADYETRMKSPELQAAYIEKQLGPLQDAYFKWTRLHMEIYGKYDSEKECFTLVPTATIDHERFPEGANVPIFWHKFSLPVPIADAPAFKEAFDSIKADAVSGAKLSLRGDVVHVDEITFTLPDGRSFKYAE